MTLYEQIKNLDQEEQRKLLGQGNTVRSLYPIRGKMTYLKFCGSSLILAQTAGDSTTWIFDTSRLPSAEVIVRAEIRGDSDQSCIVKLLKMTNQKKVHFSVKNFEVKKIKSLKKFDIFQSKNPTLLSCIKNLIKTLELLQRAPITCCAEDIRSMEFE